jgi:hypothetical protein
MTFFELPAEYCALTTISAVSAGKPTLNQQYLAFLPGKDCFISGGISALLQLLLR